MDFSMLVKEIMTPGVVSVTPDDTIGDAARLMSAYNVGALPVCGDAGEVRGMITDRDLTTRCVAADYSPETTRVGSVMTRTVIAVEQRADVREASQLMAQHRVRRLPVLDNGRLCGMVSLGDIATQGRFDMEASRALTEISQPRRGS